MTKKEQKKVDALKVYIDTEIKAIRDIFCLEVPPANNKTYHLRACWLTYFYNKKALEYFVKPDLNLSQFFKNKADDLLKELPFIKTFIKE